MAASGLALVLIALLFGPGLADKLQSNWEWLNAAHVLVRVEAAGACPQLQIVGDADLSRMDLAGPSRPRWQALLGVYLYAQQKMGEAYQMFAAAPTRTLVDDFWMGCASLAMGQTPQAVEAWRAAGAVNYFILGADHALSGGQRALALQLYDLATQIEPGNGEAWIGLASIKLDRALGGEESWPEALGAAEHAASIAPDDPRTQYILGATLWGSQTDLVRAEQLLRRAYTRTDSWLASYALAGVLVDLGQSRQALPLLEKTLEEHDTQWARLLLVRALIAEGQCDHAAATRRAALQAYPELQSSFNFLCPSPDRCGCLTHE